MKPRQEVKLNTEINVKEKDKKRKLTRKELFLISEKKKKKVSDPSQSEIETKIHVKATAALNVKKCE